MGGREGVLRLGRSGGHCVAHCRLASRCENCVGGICQAHCLREEVERVGRVSERCRFWRRGAHSARESALQAAGARKSADGEWCPQVRSVAEQLADLDVDICGLQRRASWCWRPGPFSSP